MIKCETILSLLFFFPLGNSIAGYFFYSVLLNWKASVNLMTVFFFHCFTMRSLLVIEILGAKINDFILYSAAEWFFTY